MTARSRSDVEPRKLTLGPGQTAEVQVAVRLTRETSANVLAGALSIAPLTGTRLRVPVRGRDRARQSGADRVRPAVRPRVQALGRLAGDRARPARPGPHAGRGALDRARAAARHPPPRQRGQGSRAAVEAPRRAPRTVRVRPYRAWPGRRRACSRALLARAPGLPGSRRPSRDEISGFHDPIAGFSRRIPSIHRRILGSLHRILRWHQTTKENDGGNNRFDDFASAREPVPDRAPAAPARRSDVQHRSEPDQRAAGVQEGGRGLDPDLDGRRLDQGVHGLSRPAQHRPWPVQGRHPLPPRRHARRGQGPVDVDDVEVLAHEHPVRRREGRRRLRSEADVRPRARAHDAALHVGDHHGDRPGEGHPGPRRRHERRARWPGSSTPTR